MWKCQHRCYQSFADSILFYCKFMFKDHSIPLYINAMRRKILIINIPEDYKKGGEIRVQESKNSDENWWGRSIWDGDSQDCYDTQLPSQRRIQQEVNWKLSPSLTPFGTNRSNCPAMKVKEYCGSSNQEWLRLSTTPGTGVQLSTSDGRNGDGLNDSRDSEREIM